ncbi:leucine-rich repeat receptor-like serine/threonine-protein kinase SKM1 [Prosopis cineraria]|uniref:leucine-rich repeat receptor-like serine/threonine-protein kinase SKM1 n=1 Tax=Prosopis cineraria TaxID=364024 RepID=UPI0024103372|nr:leucine-rich repeat receptor-like serine/threonine-protein kinase SKM1 [Prosopis cineraria]
MLSFSSQISVLVLMLLCAVTFHRSFCCHDRDRTLLLIFKQGVVDPSKRLSSWSSTNEDCCSWQGVICNFNTSRVQTLDLGNLNKNGSESLGGEINLSSLLALEFLDWLQLGHNDFERISTPSINTSIATHSHFPANFSLLSFMDLSYNVHLRIDNLHWLSKLPFLKILYLSGVHLPSGTKWVHSLALLPLKGLYLNDCNLNSSILSLEHANFSSLSSLDLGLNDFTCGLPNWLFNLSKDLYDLHLNQCNLRGPVPDFSGYRNLQILYLSNNKLNGLIPDWLGKHLRLCDLDLSINSFHGSIPSNLANMSSLSYLNISFNNLSGALPKNIDQITFFILDVSHNSISGDISKLKLQGGIFMSFNKFKGQLPQVPYYGVEVLDLAHNSFSGSLSSLCGHIENGALPQLKYLDLSDNYLTGELPNCLNNWTDLSYIYLGNNQLVGQLPPMIGSFLDKLRALDLHNNGFSGQVPWTIHNCTSLVLINLEGNHFSGSIPTWMPQMCQL